MNIPRIDWKKIQREYVTGALSYQELAKIHKVSISNLSKRAKKDGWVQKRAMYRTQLNDKALEAASIKFAENEIAKQGEHFRTVQEAAEKGALKCLEVIENLDAYKDKTGRIDPMVLRQLMAALKDAQHIIRTAYDVPTRMELAQLDIARQRLEIEKQKASASDADDNDTGIVIIPEREAVQDDE